MTGSICRRGFSFRRCNILLIGWWFWIPFVFADSPPQALAIRDIGVPVRSVNWVHLHAGFNQKKDACLYAAMGQNADNLFVLQIDPSTGQFQQFVSPVPKSNYPTATLMSRSGKLYIGSAYAGHLLCFDPGKNELADLGAIHPGAATFPCRMDEDAQGKIWIGSYGTADLTCYDPARAEFIRYGRMDEVDMYNYPLVNRDGLIACLIRMTKPHVVVFNPETKEKTLVGPVTTKGQETIDMHKGNDGWLYIVSSVGNFRIDGTKAVAAEAVPNATPPPTLPDGSTFAFLDGAKQAYRRLEIRHPNGEAKPFDLDYAASGNDIFYLHAGPDGCVYGSSILPLHLFRWNPQTEELADLGPCSAASGEAYSMATLDGKIYISSYPAARVSVYDPSQPYRFGEEPDSNPRDLGRIDDISYRPRSTLAGPLGRVWLASLPDYGMWGGPLSYYDPQTGTKKSYARTAGDGSCYTLAFLEKEKLIAVGTTIAGGSGTQPKVEQAMLFLWDYQAEKKIWEGTLNRSVSAFNSLLYGSDGLLYGTVTGGGVPPELFIFDPQSRTFTKQIPILEGGPLDLGLLEGPDRTIYGFTHSCIYRLHRESHTLETLVHDQFDVAGPLLGHDLYFATGHKLRSVRLLEEGKP